MHRQDHDRAKQDKQRVRATAECIHESPLLSAEIEKALANSNIRSLLGQIKSNHKSLNLLGIFKHPYLPTHVLHSNCAFFDLNW
ncbi:MAG: hypothetical protein LW709_11500 [Oxalobacteraceae bacterium]|nr:hypothetical protein [Oxalobacteraceae bacterium]